VEDVGRILNDGLNEMDRKFVEYKHMFTLLGRKISTIYEFNKETKVCVLGENQYLNGIIGLEELADKLVSSTLKSENEVKSHLKNVCEKWVTYLCYFIDY
jgi:hypothetical protein